VVAGDDGEADGTVIPVVLAMGGSMQGSLRYGDGRIIVGKRVVEGWRTHPCSLELLSAVMEVLSCGVLKLLLLLLLLLLRVLCQVQSRNSYPSSTSDSAAWLVCSQLLCLKRQKRWSTAGGDLLISFSWAHLCTVPLCC
jgi:hypothetical protein